MDFPDKGSLVLENDRRKSAVKTAGKRGSDYDRSEKEPDGKKQDRFKNRFFFFDPSGHRGIESMEDRAAGTDHL